MKRAAVLLLACAGGAAASPVERVVKLLEDLQGKLEMDEKVEQKVYDKYACWCEKTTDRKAADISEAQLDLRQYGQTILSLKGKVASLGAEIEELGKGIANADEAVEEATAIREKENAAYMAETTETKTALEAMEKAINVLVAGSMGGGAALLQERAKAKSAVRSVVAAIPVKVGLSGDHAQLFEDFLQEGAAEKYMPQSFTVQGMLKDMYSTFAANLETATRNEAKANMEFEALLATKAKETEDMKADKAKKEGEKAEAEVRLADTQAMFDDTAQQKDADAAFFDQTATACKAKHEEWVVRSDLRHEEIAGIVKALGILTSDDARELFASAIKEGKEVRTDSKYDTGRDISFLQLGDETASSAPTKAYAVLKEHARAARSLRLAALSMRVRAAKVGHFDKVIASIDDMIKTLKDEDLADIAKRDQCKEEYLKTESLTKDLQWKIKNNNAKIDKLQKLIELRTAQKAKTVQNIADVDQHMADITTMREEENDDFLARKKEDQDAIDLLMAARDALSSFYEKNTGGVGEVQGSVKGAALLQQPVFEVSADQAPDADFSDKASHKGHAKGIVSIMTMIIEDLNDEIKNGMKAEEDAQLDYESEMAAAKKLREELVAKKVSLEDAIAKRGAEKEEEIELKTENKAALDDEVSYKASITPDCDWIFGAFKKRAVARSTEMNGLVGAKEYLVGAKPASLLEQSAKPVPFDDSALSRVRFLGLRR